MQSQNRFFDDLAKILNGAAGTFAGMGREAEAGARERFREFIGGADFVSREEFEAVKQMAATARGEVESLKERIAALENTGNRTSAPKASAAAKPRVKAASAKTATGKTVTSKAAARPANS